MNRRTEGTTPTSCPADQTKRDCVLNLDVLRVAAIYAAFSCFEVSFGEHQPDQLHQESAGTFHLLQLFARRY